MGGYEEGLTKNIREGFFGCSLKVNQQVAEWLNK